MNWKGGGGSLFGGDGNVERDEVEYDFVGSAVYGAGPDSVNIPGYHGPYYLLFDCRNCHCDRPGESSGLFYSKYYPELLSQ